MIGFILNLFKKSKDRPLDKEKYKKVIKEIKNLKIGDNIKVGVLWSCIPIIRKTFEGKVIGIYSQNSTHPKAEKTYVAEILYTNEEKRDVVFSFKLNSRTDLAFGTEYIDGELILIDD